MNDAKTRTEECPDCLGSGEYDVDCSACDGEGCDDEMNPCRVCEGEGSMLVECETCGGTGKVPTEYDDGEESAG